MIRSTRMTLGLGLAFIIAIGLLAACDFPTPASGASISGDVFHDLCAVPYASIPPGDPLPEGCIDTGPVTGLQADGVYDPGEPGIENVTLRLGSGACPSTGLATATTDVNGNYSFGGLSAGTYCVSVDALSDGNDVFLIPGGWTYPVRDADPQEVTVTLTASQQETDVDFGWDHQFLPPPPALTASISGDVFHDLCAVPYASIPPGDPLPEGCIDSGPVTGLQADGIYDPGEPGIEAVTLHLGSGACPSTGLATDTTDVNGTYSFGGLAAGTYCVSVDALSDGNDLILIPGGWTYPLRDADPQEVTVTLMADQAETDIDFGWDYQFLPEPPALTATPTPEGYIVKAIMDSNCRTGPMTIFDQYGFLLENEEAEAKGRLVDNSWLSVKLVDEPNQCWIAENLLEYSFNLNELPILISPPTPTPAPGGITGIVWDDVCNPPNLTPDTPEPPPPGCETDGIFYWANGIYEAGEQGIANVIVHLGVGACPAAGLPPTTTDASGVFSFTGLAPGNYCVSISVVGNESALVPGTWSHPDVTGNWGRINVTVNPGATTGNVNFGWDFQF
jgi:protocatechuate 3,4-dioxygenase beta subunit